MLAIMGCDSDDSTCTTYSNDDDGTVIIITGGSEITPTATPEPATIFLLGTGLVLIGNKIRRKK